MFTGIEGFYILFIMHRGNKQFLPKGDGEIATELGTVKGSVTALQQSSVEKKCGV